jgi:hypothetical protein
MTPIPPNGVIIHNIDGKFSSEFLKTIITCADLFTGVSAIFEVHLEDRRAHVFTHMFMGSFPIKLKTANQKWILLEILCHTVDKDTRENLLPIHAVTKTRYILERLWKDVIKPIRNLASKDTNGFFNILPELWMNNPPKMFGIAYLCLHIAGKWENVEPEHYYNDIQLTQNMSGYNPIKEELDLARTENRAILAMCMFRSMVRDTTNPEKLKTIFCNGIVDGHQEPWVHDMFYR